MNSEIFYAIEMEIVVAKVPTTEAGTEVDQLLTLNPESMLNLSTPGSNLVLEISP